jgi:GNAT superfamily N-acetyltransferase
MIAGLLVEKLGPAHSVDVFDCGREPLNRFLTHHALQSQRANASQTYVAVSGARVAGYHTLVVGEIAYGDAPERLAKGLAKHPIPVMVLARLAVGTAWQGKGLGAALLKDALLRTLRAADIAGIRAFAVHAKDDAARAFYEHFDFAPSPADSLHLFVLLKDIGALIA